MKRVFLALCTVVMVLMACSNDDSSDSIITDKDVMYISNSGGTDTIKVLNHHHMWLISDAEVHFNDSTYWVSPIQNEVSPHQFEMDGKWFKIVIPNDNTNLIVASVTGNALCPVIYWRNEGLENVFPRKKDDCTDYHHDIVFAVSGCIRHVAVKGSYG